MDTPLTHKQTDRHTNTDIQTQDEHHKYCVKCKWDVVVFMKPPHQPTAWQL